MPRIRVDTSGDPYAIAKVIRAGRIGVHNESEEVGRNLVAAVKTTLSQPGSGRTYTTNFFTDKQGRVRPIGTRTPHTASAPGQPPAPDSGDLRDSIDYNARRLPDGAEVEVGSDLDYAVFTEMGTRKMLARPWLRPTIAAGVFKWFDPWLRGIEKRERAMARSLGGAG